MMRLFILCVLLLSHSGFGQDSKVVILEHADSLVGMVVAGEEVRELIGNVRIRQNETRISCDRALQFIRTGLVHLTGNVVLKDDGVTIRAPRGMFHREERRAEGFDNVELDDGKVQLKARYGEYIIPERRAFFRGNVKVVDSASTVTSDSLTYFRDDKRSIATGSVRIDYVTDNVTITGGHVEHWSLLDFSRVQIDPVFTQLDTSATGDLDTLVVRSHLMEAYRDSSQRMVALDSVRIVRAGLAARAGLADFFIKADSILLRHRPIIWYDATQVTGDSVDVLLQDRGLKEVRVRGDAFALSVSDSLHPEKFDQLKGERLDMHFAAKKLRAIDVERRSTSVYHLYEGELPNGLNRISGDRIHMEFVAGKIGAIRIFGGVEGQYFPENMVSGKEEEYRLAGFLKRNDRPQIVESETPRQVSIKGKR